MFLLLQLAAVVTGFILFYKSYPDRLGQLEFGQGVLILVGLVLQIAPLWLGWRVRLERSRRKGGFQRRSARR